MMSQFSYTQPYLIVGALIERNGKFLLLQENHAPNQGMWNIPSGKLDFSEDPLAGVRREVKEESGLSFVPSGIVSIASIYRHDIPEPGMNIHAFRIMYIGHAEGDVVLSDGDMGAHEIAEISAYKWLDLGEIEAHTSIVLRYADIVPAIKNFLARHTLSVTAVQHVIQSGRQV